VTLPTTYEEAIEQEVVRFAKSAIDYINAKPNPWTSQPVTSSEAGHAWLRDLLPRLMGTAIGRMGVITLAKSGYVEAAEFLREVAIECQSRHCELPAELKTYEMEVRLRRGDNWPKRSGPNKLDFIMRDIFLAVVVAAVLDRFPNLKEMQSSPRSLSACSAVAEAMFGRQERIRGRAYSTVKKIWLHYRNAVPTRPGMANRWFG
jgi:hypothetical protein